MFPRTGGVWTQQAYLKASNTGPATISAGRWRYPGDTVVVGACRGQQRHRGQRQPGRQPAIGSGAAYVFVRSGGRPGPSRPTSRPPIPRPATTSATQSRSPATRWWWGPCEDSAATGVNGNQADNSAANAERPTSSCATVGSGPSRPTSRPPIPARATGSAGRSRFPATRWWSGRRVRTATPPGVNGNQADNSAADAGRGLRVRPQRSGLDPAGLPQGLQHRSR